MQILICWPKASWYTFGMWIGFGVSFVWICSFPEAISPSSSPRIGDRKRREIMEYLANLLWQARSICSTYFLSDKTSSFQYLIVLISESHSLFGIGKFSHYWVDPFVLPWRFSISTFHSLGTSFGLKGMTSQQLTVGNVVYGAGGAFNKCLGRTNQGESLKASGRRRQGER